MLNTFVYQARDAAGRLLRGELAAASQREALQTLTAQGLFVTQLAPLRSKSNILQAALRSLLHGKYVMLLCRELAVTVSAGMTVSDALTLLAGDSRAGREQELLQDLAARVRSGSTLTAALREHGEYFSDAVCYMVAVGEHSGRLGEMLQQLATRLEKDNAAREKLLTILLYPCVLLGVTMAVVCFLVRFVLPVFASFFQELHTQLPLPTRLVLGLSSWLEGYGLLLLLLPVPLLLLAALLWQREEVRLVAERLARQLPGLGRLLMYTELSRFAGTLGILLGSGVVIDQALELLQEITTGACLRRGLQRACEDVRKGLSLSRSLQQTGIFPAVQLGLLHAGEETGSLEEVLASIARFAEQEADNTAERLKVLLEPLLILMLGAVVGTVVMAIALPILESMTLLSY